MQAVVGATVTVSGVVILASIDPGWNWLGALGAGLGPAILLLGVTDILNKGDNGVRRVARLLRVVHLTGWFLTIALVVLDLLLSLLAVGLLAVAVFQGQWSQSVESLLASAALVAGMALGVALMVRVAELPIVPLARISWWRELGNLQQFTHVAIAVAFVGTAVAFGLRDVGGAAIAMVGLATVLLGWGRADRIATDEGIRRLAEAADAVSAALRPWSPTRPQSVLRAVRRSMATSSARWRRSSWPASVTCDEVWPPRPLATSSTSNSSPSSEPARWR